MDTFDLNKISSSDKINQNTSKKRTRTKKVNSEEKIAGKGVTNPSVELDDFFEYLDPKVVEKIVQMPEKTRARIVKDVQQYEYDINGAENIFNSLG